MTPPLVAVLTPNHAPFGHDWAAAARLGSRVATVEWVGELSLDRLSERVASDGETYQITDFDLRPSRFLSPASARVKAARLDECLRAVESDHGPISILHSHYYHQMRHLRHLQHRAPVVHTEHSLAIAAETLGDSAHYRLSACGRRIAERGYRDAAAVIAVSTYMADALRSQFDVEPIIIPNPVDTDTFQPSEQRESSLVVAVCRLSSDKRPELLLRGFAEAAKRDPQLRLEWFGGGGALAILNEEAKALGVDSRVTMHGRTDRSKIASTVAWAGVFLNTAEHETFGVAVAEALVAGSPVVCPAVGALPEMVGSDNGILVDQPTAASLGSAIEQALGTEWDNEQIARTARARFSFEAVGEAVTELYLSVLEASS